MTIGIVGHCQATSIAHLLGVITRRDDFQAISARDLSGPEADETAKTLAGCDRLVVLSNWTSAVKALMSLEHHPKITVAPTLYFTGFHPDFVYASGGAVSPLGNPLSALALYGFVNGLGIGETVSLFRDDVYQALGYYDNWDASMAALAEEERKTGIALNAMVKRWMALGCFFYTPNHPVLPVMIDIAVALAETMSLQIHLRRPHRLIADPFVSGPVFPVFPEVARRHGIDGDYLFRVPIRNMDLSPWKATFDLPAFVTRFYKQNETIDPAGIVCKRFNSGQFDVLKGLLGKPATKMMRSHPYRGLPSHQFWKNAVAQVAVRNMDPVAGDSLKIDKNHKIAAAGSCFAQHVTKRLDREGYHYFVAEDGADLVAAERARRNYRVYSARYGNLYTARQLLQLFDRSEGTLIPHDSAWRRDERYIDPFRPEIEPDGFASVEALGADRATHLDSVRRMWRDLDIFIFTLGLTETWRSKIDGTVFPLAPGVSGGEMDDTLYEFHNFSAGEVTDDLFGFVDRLRSVNPAARMILTVSPVPLVATYEKRHVIVSTVYSKSALRTAAETVSKTFDFVEYFPSYEIITGSYNNGVYFEPDKRSVTSAGVDHVMEIFLKHHRPEEVATSGENPSGPGRLSAIAAEIMDSQGVVCEEELLQAED